jgi:thioredoxin-like negative regulator of GroEL
MSKPQSVITQAHIDSALTYQAYTQLSEEYFAKGRTTSDADDLNTPKHLEYTKLNLQRMSRIYKTTAIREDLQEAVRKISQRWVWLVLSESWCGDAAQNLPVLERLAAISENNIEVKILLRDRHPDVMEAYLTGSARAIPKLICLRAATLDEIGHWGPRPEAAQRYVMEQKVQGVEHDTMIANVHAWYAKDKTESLQSEILACVLDWASAK